MNLVIHETRLLFFPLSFPFFFPGRDDSLALPGVTLYYYRGSGDKVGPGYRMGLCRAFNCSSSP